MNTQKQNIWSDYEYVKLTLDSHNKLWFLDGKFLPRLYKGRVSNIFKNFPFRNRNVRVVGFKNNIKLVIKLYELKRKNIINSLQICGPDRYFYYFRENRIEELLFCIRSVSDNYYFGGWKEFSLKEYPSYAIYSIFNDIHDDAYKDKIYHFLKFHPAWPYWSFVSNINIDCLASVVSHIIDPRWFLDFSSRVELAKIERYFGLTGKIYKNIVSGKCRGGVRTRYLDLLNCWKGKIPDKNSKGSFVWDYWFRAKNSDTADLYASRYFLKFLFLSWLDSLSSRQETFFVPRYFFNNKKYTEEFIKYQRNFNKE